MERASIASGELGIITQKEPFTTTPGERVTPQR